MIFVGAVRCCRTTRSPVVLVGGHARRGGAAAGTGRGTRDPRDRARFTRFYMRVWALFFLEYLLVPIACLAHLTCRWTSGREQTLPTVGPRGVDNPARGR